MKPPCVTCVYTIKRDMPETFMYCVPQPLINVLSCSVN